MKKNKLVKMIIIASLVCLIIFPLTSKVFGASSSSSIDKYSVITVSPGDTLWTIARVYINKNDDIRKLVYDIKKINKLNSVILTPGQELLIPNE